MSIFWPLVRHVSESSKNVNPEANMAIQNTTSQAPKAPLTAIFGLVTLVLCGDPLGEAAAHFGQLICALAAELLKFAPSIVLAGCHVLGSYILAHQQVFLCVQTLLSFSPLLHFICGAA
jgi:hypothetical protein